MALSLETVYANCADVSCSTPQLHNRHAPNADQFFLQRRDQCAADSTASERFHHRQLGDEAKAPFGLVEDNATASEEIGERRADHQDNRDEGQVQCRVEARHARQQQIEHKLNRIGLHRLAAVHTDGAAQDRHRKQ